MFQNKFFIQHFLGSKTISNVDFNAFELSNVYSNVFIKNNKWSYSFNSQFYSTSIMNSSEGETSPVKGVGYACFHWFSHSVKWGQKFGLIRTHSQWYSSRTYLWSSFGLQPFTPENVLEIATFSPPFDPFSWFPSTRFYKLC